MPATFTDIERARQTLEGVRRQRQALQQRVVALRARVQAQKAAESAEREAALPPMAAHEPMPPESAQAVPLADQRHAMRRQLTPGPPVDATPIKDAIRSTLFPQRKEEPPVVESGEVSPAQSTRVAFPAEIPELAGPTIQAQPGWDTRPGLERLPSPAEEIAPAQSLAVTGQPIKEPPTIGRQQPEQGTLSATVDVVSSVLTGRGIPQAQADKITRSVLQPGRAAVANTVLGFMDTATGIATDPFGLTGYRPFEPEDRESIFAMVGSFAGLVVPAGTIHKALGPAVQALGKQTIERVLSRVPAKIVQGAVEGGSVGAVYTWLSHGSQLTPEQALEEALIWSAFGAGFRAAGEGAKGIIGKLGKRTAPPAEQAPPFKIEGATREGEAAWKPPPAPGILDRLKAGREPAKPTMQEIKARLREEGVRGRELQERAREEYAKARGEEAPSPDLKPALPKAKEPWEMTREEVRKIGESGRMKDLPWMTDEQAGRLSLAEFNKEGFRGISEATKLAERNANVAEAAHKELVESAAREGKIGAGLADYPDLAKKAKPPPKPPGAAVTERRQKPTSADVSEPKVVPEADRADAMYAFRKAEQMLRQEGTPQSTINRMSRGADNLTNAPKSTLSKLSDGARERITSMMETQPIEGRRFPLFELERKPGRNKRIQAELFRAGAIQLDVGPGGNVVVRPTIEASNYRQELRPKTRHAFISRSESKPPKPPVPPKPPPVEPRAKMPQGVSEGQDVFFITRQEYSGLTDTARRKLGPVEKVDPSEAVEMGAAGAREHAGGIHGVGKGSGEEGYIYRRRRLTEEDIDKARESSVSPAERARIEQEILDAGETSGAQTLAANLKKGDRVKVGDETLTVTKAEPGDIVLSNDLVIHADEFTQIPGKVIPRTEKTAAGDQVTFAPQREVPTAPIRQIGRKAKTQQTQGDAFQPDKIAPGNLPQDQGGLFAKPSPRAAGGVVAGLDKIEAAAKARIAERFKRSGDDLTLRTGIDPKIAADVAANLKDLGIIGAAKIARGAVKFEQWSTEMVRDFGDKIKPHLKSIYDRAKRQNASDRSDQVFTEFTEYYKGISAPEGYRPPKRRTLVAIRAELRRDGYRGTELTQRADAAFNAQAQHEGIALRQTKGGRVLPSVRQSGIAVSGEFANYKGFKDAKPGSMGGTKPPEYFLQEIDGALSVEAKAKLPGQMGPAEKFIEQRTRDMMLNRIDWSTGQKSRLEMIFDGLSKEQRVKSNFVLEKLSNRGSRLSVDQVAKMPRVRLVTTDINVVRAAVEMRHFTEHLLKQQNTARGLRNQSLIPHREYYTAEMFRDATLWDWFSAEKTTPKELFSKHRPPLPDYIKPNGPFNPRAQARQRGLPADARIMDPLHWGELYVESAGKDIFYTSIVQNNKGHALQLESMGFRNAARGIQDWTAEGYSGVAGGLDRWMNLPPAAMKVMNRFRRGLAIAVFPLNVTWTGIVQASSTAMGLGRYGFGTHITGLADWLTKPAVRKQVRQSYAYRIKRQRGGRFTWQDINEGVGGGRKINRSTYEAVADYANIFADTMERCLTSWSIAAARRYGMKRGLKGRALDKMMSDGGAKVQGMYNLENQTGVLRNKIVKTFMPFNTFAFNVVNMVREVSGKTGMPPAKVSERIAVAIRFAAAATAFNYVGQAAIGRKPWELSSFIPFYGSTVGPLWDMATGQRTASGTRGLPAPIGITAELIKGIKSFAQHDDWDGLRKWATKYLTGFAGVPGGIQLNRIVDGLIAQAQEEVTDVRGKKLFDVKTPTDKTRAIVAGPWTLPQARTRFQKKRLDIVPKAVKQSAIGGAIMENLPIVSDIVGETKSRSATIAKLTSLRRRWQSDKAAGRDDEAAAKKAEALQIVREYNSRPDVKRRIKSW